ncbi:MAG: NAD(P)H-hydrate dehydratase [Comamonadaceae bacterium]|nr:MAG: NAD(P)H-hydrate dehydratase [Comamonadaceae bacterium]
MQPITPATAWPLHSVSATREIERLCAGALPAHTLMQRAGLATARLALALAPHARRIWIACGPGNNGGDGFEAAFHLHRAGKTVLLTWTGIDTGKTFPVDAQVSMEQALSTGLLIKDAPPKAFDFCIDALLGIGGNKGNGGSRGSRWSGANDSPERLPDSPAAKRLARHLALIRASTAPVLAIDVPSGLDAGTGNDFGTAMIASGGGVRVGETSNTAGPRFTLSLLTLKPGLFMAAGRDLAGEVWLHELASRNPSGESHDRPAPTAWLSGSPTGSADTARHAAPHASHKGSFGDVAVIGGETREGSSMAGAALLAARAALHAGAGRVMVSLLGTPPIGLDMSQPELMFRATEALDLQKQVAVCGCGGGDAVAQILPDVFSTAWAAVFDADALNAIANDSTLAPLLAARANRGWRTVLTPHPLEAARLLGCGAAEVQRDRLSAATELAGRFHCTVVLKGSGTVIATPGQLPQVNPTGNALLATAGTGDVLAGIIGAGLARGLPAAQAASRAVFHHAEVADRWAAAHPAEPFTASRLAKAVRPF